MTTEVETLREELARLRNLLQIAVGFIEPLTEASAGWDAWLSKATWCPDAIVTASITARGADSAVPDNPGAVDATIFVDGRRLGAVTLLPGDDGELGTWGSPENWADDGVGAWLAQQDAPGAMTEEIVDAVRAAVANAIGGRDA